jgi:hypothetical protein
VHIDVNVRFSQDPETVTLLHRILAKLDGIQTKETRIMASLDDVLTDVTAEGTQIDSLSTLTAGLAQQLKDALAGTTLPASVQAKVDAVFAGVEANKGKVIAAINANTPAANVPPTA